MFTKAMSVSLQIKIYKNRFIFSKLIIIYVFLKFLNKNGDSDNPWLK